MSPESQSPCPFASCTIYPGAGAAGAAAVFSFRFINFLCCCFHRVLIPDPPCLFLHLLWVAAGVAAVASFSILVNLLFRSPSTSVFIPQPPRPHVHYHAIAAPAASVVLSVVLFCPSSFLFRFLPFFVSFCVHISGAPRWSREKKKKSPPCFGVVSGNKNRLDRHSSASYLAKKTNYFLVCFGVVSIEKKQIISSYALAPYLAKKSQYLPHALASYLAKKHIISPCFGVVPGSDFYSGKKLPRDGGT
ncbi:MAG: hypothetical protein ABJ059_05930 [Hyphomicrobiales bacterium]